MNDSNKTKQNLVDELLELRQRIAELESESEGLRESEVRYHSLYSAMGEGFCLHEIIYDGPGVAVDYRILDVNPAYELIMGLSKEQATDSKASELYGTGRPLHIEIYAEVAASGQSTEFEAYFPPMDKHLSISVFSPCKGQFATIFSDISERIWIKERLQRQGTVLEAINKVLQETLICETEAEVANVCLAVAEALTGSKFGFIGEVNESGRFDTIALSAPGWDACKIPEFDAVAMIRDMEVRGIWGKVIRDGVSLIVNDPGSHPESIGTPIGHLKLAAFLGVPLRSANRIFGMIALANKESGYTTHDQEAIEALSLSIVEALMRKLRDIELAEQREQLEERVEERTRELAQLSSTLQDRVDQTVSELRKRDEAERQRMIREIDQAREVQTGLFPQLSPQVAGLDIWGVCHPAYEVGGDFFDYLTVGPDKLCIALGDVAGKGMRGAMTAAIAHGMLHAEARASDSLPTIISELNADLFARLDNAAFIALSLAVIDTQSRKLRLCNTGNPYPIRLRRGQPSLLELGGIPLGIMPEIEYDETHLTLTPGDIVILYSDGVTEAIGSGDRVYGMDALRDLISTLQPNLSAQSMVEKIIESVRAFAGDRPQSDDMTVIAICVKE